jgi:hypothetical protein
MRLRRWSAGHRFTNRDRDQVCVVIQPQSGQRNELSDPPRSKRRPGARLVAAHQGRSCKRASTDSDPWKPHRVPLRATSEVVVIDPEDGRAGVRSNERHIVDRASGARGLGRLITALDEHGTVRKARPVRLRGAV